MGYETNITRTALEAAPEKKDWAATSVYDSIYLLPTRKKHDSGFHLICIVGAMKDGTLEKAAWCDDICWHIHVSDGRLSMRTDMTYPGGIAHMWGWSLRFEIGMSLSSTDVHVYRNPKEKA